MLEATTYTRVCEQQQLGKCWCVIAGVLSENLKLYLHKLFLDVFCVRKYVYSEKKRITVFGLKVIM